MEISWGTELGAGLRQLRAVHEERGEKGERRGWEWFHLRFMGHLYCPEFIKPTCSSLVREENQSGSTGSVLSLFTKDFLPLLRLLWKWL